MKMLSLLCLLVATSCASRSRPSLVIKVTQLPTAIPTDSVRHVEIVRAYHLGRYVDPNQPGVMHEPHPVYRVEVHSRWNLQAHPASWSLPTAVHSPPDEAYSPLSPHDLMVAELNQQKDATERVMRDATQLVRSYDQLQNVITDLTAVARNYSPKMERFNQTEHRLKQIEKELEQILASAMANEFPTQRNDDPEEPGP